MRSIRSRYSRPVVLLGAAGLLVLVGAISFWVGRAVSDDGPAAATDPSPTPAATAEPGATSTPIPTFPGNDITPPPDATPDTSQPFWWVPYQNADRMKPRFTGVVAGILVGPEVQATGIPCAVGEAVVGTEEDVEGTPLEILEPDLPPGATLIRQEVTNCRGRAIHNSLSFEVAPDHDAGYFGGSLDITRTLSDPAVAASFPEDRWRELDIAGRHVALASPILPELGLGASMAIFYEHESSLITIVSAFGIPESQLLAVVESLGQ